MSATRWLAAEAKRSGWHWLEAVLITLAACTVAYLASPADPLLLKSAFPWLLFPPVLLALRYGALSGMASTALLAAVWLVQREAGVVQEEPPVVPLAGALMLTLVCGEFAGLWNSRLGRAEGSLRFVREKLDRLTREHYLLLASHHRLEQDQLARPISLRAALSRIRQLSVEPAPRGELPGAQALASLLAQFCQLEDAGLHDCRGSTPAPRPLAFVGTAAELDPADPLVRHCVEHRGIAHVRLSPAGTHEGPRYLVVAPVVSSDGELIAVLAVREMAFLALHEETLSMLAVLLGYYADALRVSRAARVIQRALPRCPIEFADELVRAHRMRVEEDVPSALLLLVLGEHPESAAFAAFIRRQVRDVDRIWDLSNAILLLLPLANEIAAADALERLERDLEAHYRVGFDAARIRAHSTQLGGPDAFVALKLFLDRHDVRL